MKLQLILFAFLLGSAIAHPSNPFKKYQKIKTPWTKFVTYLLNNKLNLNVIEDSRRIGYKKDIHR